jgi:hypothetical protein
LFKIIFKKCPLHYNDGQDPTVRHDGKTNAVSEVIIVRGTADVSDFPYRKFRLGQTPCQVLVPIKIINFFAFRALLDISCSSRYFVFLIFHVLPDISCSSRYFVFFLIFLVLDIPCSSRYFVFFLIFRVILDISFPLVM